MISSRLEKTPVEAFSVPDRDKSKLFELYFDEDYLKVESLISEELIRYGVNLTGIKLEFMKLSNSGFFAYPKLYNGSQVIEVPLAKFENELSEMSIGIIACLNVYYWLQENVNSFSYSQHYTFLKQYALRSPEASLILEATTILK